MLAGTSVVFVWCIRSILQNAFFPSRATFTFAFVICGANTERSASGRTRPASSMARRNIRAVLAWGFCIVISITATCSTCEQTLSLEAKDTRLREFDALSICLTSHCQSVRTLKYFVVRFYYYFAFCVCYISRCCLSIAIILPCDCCYVCYILIKT